MKYVLSSIIVAVAVVTIYGQKIAKPTLIPKDLTETQQQLVREGVKLHDEKNYTAAILKYELVLSENPDATLALYELAMSLYSNGEKEKAVETAVRGTKYRSKELPLFYLVIANSLDDVGKPKESVKIYRDAVSMLKDDKEMRPHLASIYYNLGVTFTRQKLYNEARAELKNAVEANHLYASPHYLLGEVFIGTKYKVPALLAAIRLISLEANTQRTDRAVAIIQTVMKPAEKSEKTGNTTINLDLFSATDEGEFGMYDLLIPTLSVIDEKKEPTNAKTHEEKFADSVDTVISMLAEDKKLKSTFVGRQYVPFVAEMKSRGYSRVLSYIVLYRSGNQSAIKWLTENDVKLRAFVDWAKSYTPSNP